MKIEDRKKPVSVFDKKPAPFSSGKDTSLTETVNFAQNLKEAKKEKNNEEIAKLMSRLNDLGGRLEKSPSLKEFYLYRDTVKTLMRKIIPQALALEKVYSHPTLAQPQVKEYHLIRETSRELSSLLELISQKEKANLKITAAVIRIKGLIIDYLR